MRMTLSFSLDAPDLTVTTCRLFSTGPGHPNWCDQRAGRPDAPLNVSRGRGSVARALITALIQSSPDAHVRLMIARHACRGRVRAPGGALRQVNVASRLAGQSACPTGRNGSAGRRRMVARSPFNDSNVEPGSSRGTNWLLLALVIILVVIAVMLIAAQFRP